jgi:hypothetical protein
LFHTTETEGHDTVAGNAEGAKKGNQTRAERTTTSEGGQNPAPGTGEWARQHGLWKDGDTEGRAPKP